MPKFGSNRRHSLATLARPVVLIAALAFGQHVKEAHNWKPVVDIDPRRCAARRALPRGRPQPGVTEVRALAA